MIVRIWDKTIIEKLFIVGSSVRVSCLAVLSRSGFAPKVIKVTRVAFTAKHAEPIRDRPCEPFYNCGHRGSARV